MHTYTHKETEIDRERCQTQEKNLETLVESM